MGNRRAAHRELAKEGLHIADRGVAFRSGGRIAHVADRQRSRQGLHQAGLGEVVADIAKAAGRVEAFVRVKGDDAAGLLPAVLQCMQTEGNEVRCVGDAYDAKDAAFFFQLVIIKRVAGGQVGHLGLCSESGVVRMALT